MIRRSDITVADALGTPEPGVYIAVKNLDGTLAAIFDDGGSAMANPFQSGVGGAFAYNAAEGTYVEEYRLSLSDGPRKVLEITLSASGLDGLFINAPNLDVPIGTDVVQTTGYSSLDKGGALYVYDAAVNSAYVSANPRTSFVTVNGRGFRLSVDGEDLRPEWFGAKGDWVGVPGSGTGTGTDDYAAFQAMLAFIAAENRNYDTVSRSGRGVLLTAPAYYVSDTFDYKVTVYYRAAGSGMAGGFGTRIVTAADKCGHRIHVYNSNGTAGPGTAGTGGGGSTFDGITFESLRGTPGELKAGVWMRNRAHLSNCRFIGWPGPGLLVLADVGASDYQYGNANGWSAENCRIDRCGYGGLRVRGGDSNAGAAVSIDISGCARYGADIQSFLGSGLYDIQTESCGVNGAYNLNQTSVVSDGSYRYRLKHGQDASGAGTAPTTGTSNSVWECVGAGGVHPSFPLYSTYTGAYVSGGSFYVAGGSSRAGVMNGYCENDQAPPIVTEPAFIAGGQMLVTDPTVSAMYGGAQGMTCTTGFRKKWADPGNGKIIESGIGGDDALALRYAYHTDYAPNTWRECFGIAGYRPADLFLAYQNSTSLSPWTVTGPTTVEQFGRGAAQPYYFHALKFALGGSLGADDSRIMAYGSAAPTTGPHARGEIVFNNAPSAGGKVGWVCTTAGTPGTWKPFGVIDA